LDIIRTVLRPKSKKDAQKLEYKTGLKAVVPLDDYLGFIMPIIEKTIEVPENRRVNLELVVPDNIPTGKAKIQVTITQTRDKWPTLEDLNQYKGILKDLPIFEGNSVEIQRKMRDE
jgi:hypothetical protein